MDLLESFLSGRFQSVALNVKTSKWSKIEAAIPQGSIIVTYMYNLSTELYFSTTLDANETSLFSIVHNVNETVTNLAK